MTVRPSGLSSPDRLAALQGTGLGARPDLILDGYCQAVQQALRVPLALVSLVAARRQYFPGQAGLPPHLAGTRQTPLTHSFCQHVVRRGTSVVIPDTSRPGSLAATGAVAPELGVRAYAGTPLTDNEGLVLGALCVVDRAPRDWSDAEMRTLGIYAGAVSAELQRRIALRQP